jgi:hypothetical protein
MERRVPGRRESYTFGVQAGPAAAFPAPMHESPRSGHPTAMEIIGILILVGVVAFVLITKRDKKRKV